MTGHSATTDGSTGVTFGLHTGPARTGMNDLIDVWRAADDGPFDWVSIWDHLYAADGTNDACFDAVVAHTALAMTTSRVRCGSLVYCAGFRSPSILAKAMTAIDHLSEGRCDLGLGAGWLRREYDAFGFEFPNRSRRSDQLEDAARVARALLHDGFCDLDLPTITLNDARNEPRPVQERLPIWVGGTGSLRTLPTAARWADGWNAPYLSPESYASISATLDECCQREGRDPATLMRSVNVAFGRDDVHLAEQFADLTDAVRPGAIVGGADEIAEAVAAYGAAGAQRVIFVLRAPFNVALVEEIAAAVEPLLP